jgi:predicted transcriptional regulator
MYTCHEKSKTSYSLDPCGLRALQIGSKSGSREVKTDIGSAELLASFGAMSLGLSRYAKIKVLNEGSLAMSEVTFTFQVDRTLNHEFDQAAKLCDRNSAQLIRDFMRDFVSKQQEMAEHDIWFQREVQAGINAANAGDIISAEEVEAEAKAWRSQMQKRRSGSHV